MAQALRKVRPGILLAIGAVLVAGLAVAAKRATDFDIDLNWEDLPA